MSVFVEANLLLQLYYFHIVCSSNFKSKYQYKRPRQIRYQKKIELTAKLSANRRFPLNLGDHMILDLISFIDKLNNQVYGALMLVEYSTLLIEV